MQDMFEDLLPGAFIAIVIWIIAAKEWTILILLAVSGVVAAAVLLFISNQPSTIRLRTANERHRTQAETYRKSVDALATQPPRPPWRFELPLNGREIIIPRRLIEGRLYRIQLTGSFTWDRSDEDCGRGDALYQTDRQGNFSAEFAGGKGLRINRKARTDWPPHRIVTHEPHNHRYVVELDGTGDFPSIAFGLGELDVLPAGSLDVTISEAPEGVETLAAEREREQAARRAQKKRALCHKQATEFERKLAALRLLSEPLQNWSDETFRTVKATKHRKALLRDGRKIIDNYLSLHREDPELIAYVRAEDPAIYGRLTGKFQCLLHAERLELERLERKKPSTVDVRDAIVRRFNVIADDELAIIDAAIAAHETKRNRLLECGLDEDQVEDVLGPLREVVEDALSSQQKPRKGADNAALTLG